MSDLRGRAIPLAVQASLTALSCFLASVVIFRGVLAGYQPWFDNIPLIVNSTPLGQATHWSWFTRGFTGYFDNYPGWPSPGSAFIRPGVNLLFWIDFHLFGSYWPRYLLMNYVLHSLAVALVFVIARRYLQQRTYAAAAAAALFALSSATTLSLLHPSYAGDVLAGILVLCGFLAMASDRLALASCVLSCAVLTKETALVAPVAALATVIWRARFADHESAPRPNTLGLLARCALVSLPLWLWCALRLNMAAGIEGTYPVAGLHQALLQGGVGSVLLRAVEFWPTGFASYSAVSKLGPMANPLLVCCNLCLIIALVSYLALRVRGRPGSRTAPPADGTGLVALWAATYLPFLLVAPQETRHAYAFFMFAFPLTVQLYVAGGGWMRRGLAASVLAISLMAGVRTVWQLTQPTEIRNNFQTRYRIARELVSSLRDADHAGCSTAYIVPNVVEYGSPEALRVFAGVTEHVVNLTTVDGLYDGSLSRSGGTSISADEEGVQVTSTIPQQLHFIFQIPELPGNRIIRRAGNMVYELPEASSAKELGRTARIRLRSVDARACFITFDFSKAHYSLLPMQEIAARDRAEASKAARGS